jgi:hypothetical protein
MKKFNAMFLGLISAAVLVFTACEKEKADPEKVTVLDVHDKMVQWVYFSFGESQINPVTVSNHQESQAWDLGVYYQSFRTNSGTSGNAQGGIYDLGQVNFESVTLASIAGAQLVADTEITVLASAAMPPSWANVPGSVPLETMFETPTGPNRTYAPNNHIYVIKTANGRRVKVQGVSFFNDLGQEGFINLKWAWLD